MNEIERRRNQRDVVRAWIDGYREAVCCADCGYIGAAAIDFHHTGDKDLDVSGAIRNRWSIDRLRAELKSTIAVCANCHRQRHAAMRAAAGDA